MSTITASTRGHSCVALQRGDARLVIDPGGYGDPAAADDADAVLITHEHVDHVVIEPLAALLASTPHLQVWAPQAVVTQLADAGADTARVHVATPGDAFEAAGFQVLALGGRHAVIHPDLPQAANVAYLVEGVALHPGDSFTAAPDDATVRVLFVPVAGPWMKVADAVDYARQVGAATTVPIHDAILSEGGKALVDRLMTGLVPATQYRRLTAGESLEI